MGALLPSELKRKLTKTGHATAPGTGRSAPATTGNLTTAWTTAVGGTAQVRMTGGAMTSGCPATSSLPGRNAMAELVMASTGHATAHGSGRSAPATTGNLTTALTLAVGGTALMRMMTGLMTGGSPATNSPHGTPAGGEQSRFYDDSSFESD